MGPFTSQLQLQAILAFVHCSCITMRITLAIVLFAAVGAFALPQRWDIKPMLKKDGGVKEATAPEKVEKVAVEVEATEPQTTTAPVVQETKVLKPATIDIKVEEPDAKPEAKPEAKAEPKKPEAKAEPKTPEEKPVPKPVKPAPKPAPKEEPKAAKPVAKPEAKQEVTPEERPCVERYRDCLQQAEWVPANIYGYGSNLFTCL